MRHETRGIIRHETGGIMRYEIGRIMCREPGPHFPCGNRSSNALAMFSARIWFPVPAKWQPSK